MLSERRQSIHQSGWSQPLMLEKIAAAAAPTPQKIRALSHLAVLGTIKL